MSTPKRTGSPAMSEGRTKMAKMSHESDKASTAELPARQHGQEAQVAVKLRSASKAARNDPKPPDYWNNLFASALSGRNAGDSPSRSAGNNRAAGCATHPDPTPVRPDPSAVPGRSEASTPVDNPHRRGDGPIAGHAEESSSDHST